MIITPHRCKNFIEKNFTDNINKTCKLKGKCQLISDKKSCSKYEERKEDENRGRNKRTV